MIGQNHVRKYFSLRLQFFTQQNQPFFATHFIKALFLAISSVVNVVGAVCGDGYNVLWHT